MKTLTKSNMVITGSTALVHHFLDEFPRKIGDIDIICSKNTYRQYFINKPVKWKSIEDWELSKKDVQNALVKFENEDITYEFLFSDGVSSLELILNQFSKDVVLPVEVLYSLKKAHIHFPIKFKKHITDLMFMRYKLREKLGITMNQDLGAESDLLDKYPALTEMHFKETEKRRGKLKTPKMSEDRSKFFGKSKKFFKSYYIHDNMHLAMAHSQGPVYLNILKEGAEVETDHELWKSLTIQQKIWCVLEEVYVIALERKVLPQLFEADFYAHNNWKLLTPKEAFDWALMRVCTTLCDGFFREFAVRAFDEINKQYDPQYVEKFFTNIHKYETNEEPI